LAAYEIAIAPRAAAPSGIEGVRLDIHSIKTRQRAHWSGGDHAGGSATDSHSVKCGLSKSPVKNPDSNAIDAAMNETVETFRVDLAGHYDFDREIRSAVDSFYGLFDTDADGDIKAGEYQLPDGRMILLTNDVHMGLQA
jgi:hypothetical protein